MTPPARRTPPRRKGSIGGGNPVADDVEHTPPVSPRANAEWKPAEREKQKPAGPAPEATFQPPVPDSILEPTAVLEALPDPDEPASDSPTLDERERREFARCEAAIRNLNVAFWQAGRALEAIFRRRYYRETHPTFVAYLETWGMGKSQAYRLMESWRLAERVSLIGDTNLGQVQELVPLAKRHGLDAAVTVYRTVAETPGVKVTAKKLAGAVAVLPEDQWDEDEAVQRIRAYLAGELEPATAPEPDPEERVQQVRVRLRKLVRPDIVRAAGPAAVKEVADELRRLADEVEQPGE